MQMPMGQLHVPLFKASWPCQQDREPGSWHMLQPCTAAGSSTVRRHAVHTGCPQLAEGAEGSLAHSVPCQIQQVSRREDLHSSDPGLVCGPSWIGQSGLEC